MKQLLTIGVTTSPAFMLRNFIRDAIHSHAINPDNMKFGTSSMKGWIKAIREDEMYQAAMAAGASFQGGFVHATDPNASADMMRRAMRKKGMRPASIRQHERGIAAASAIGDTLLKGWEYYRTGGDKIENASRIATLQAAIDAGKPMAQALFESKDLMDYSRRGNYQLLIDMTDLIPFMNARLQGIDKLGRAGKEFPKMVAWKLAKLAALSVALAALNADDDRYKELQDWEKDMYWHFWIPLSASKKDDIYTRWPKPFEYGILGGTIPERLYNNFAGNQTNDKLLWSFNHAILQTLAFDPWPQLLKPVVEVAAYNRSAFYDTPIHTWSDERVESHRRFSEFTSPTAIWSGNTELAKWIGVSPKQLQYLWEGYTGTMGAYVLKAADTIVTRPLVGSPPTLPIKSHDVPGWKALFPGDRKKATQYQTDFYDRMKEVDQLHGTMMDYIEKGDREKAIQYREENRDKLQWQGALQSRAKMFKQLRDRRDIIMRDMELTPEQKWEQTQAIQARINDIAQKIEADSRSSFEN